jgi:hypothetical protein
MKRLKKTGVLLMLLLVLLLAIPTNVMAAQPPVNLGTTASFAILAGTTITNTGPTTISGDAGGNVGLHPGSAFPGIAGVTTSGFVHLADAVALQAQNDLIAAYDDAAGRTPVTIIATELGGKTLIPGVYASESGTFQITGTLTLDAQGDPNGVFIFKTTFELTTAPNSNVNIIGSARYCRIFWKIGSSATLGVNSHFIGHIFALTSIAAQTGATIQGQLLARNGAVTLDSNTITNGLCNTITVSPTVSPTISPTVSPTVSPTPPISPTSTTSPTTTTTTTTSPASTTVTTSTTSNTILSTSSVRIVTPTTTTPELTETGESSTGSIYSGIALILLGVGLFYIIYQKRKNSKV